MPSVVTDARIIFIFVHCNNAPSWYWNLQFVHISWLRSHAFQFYWEMHSFDILFTIKQNRITIEVNSNIYISLGYSMHSHTETERSIFILYAYTHFPSDEKKSQFFFYGPTENDIGKGSVKCNATPACSSLLYWESFLDLYYSFFFFYRFLICKRRVSLFSPLEMKIPIFLRSKVYVLRQTRESIFVWPCRQTDNPF